MRLVLAGDWPADLAAAATGIEQALAETSEVTLPQGTIGVKLVDDSEMASLNEQYSGNAYPTDVLTFSYRESDATTTELADVVISTETARRQAHEAGTTLADEVGLLVLHGVLHAAGMDHQSGDEQRHINRLQAAIMKHANLTYRNFTWAQ
jgi:probable rRNA maturation factor